MTLLFILSAVQCGSEASLQKVRAAWQQFVCQPRYPSCDKQFTDLPLKEPELLRWHPQYAAPGFSQITST